MVAILVVVVNRFGSVPREFLAANFWSSQCSRNLAKIGSQRSSNAWVYMANSDRVLMHTLVSAKSARLHGSKADIAILWFGNECPQECMLDAADSIGAQFLMVDPPLSSADMKNKVYASIITKLGKWWDFVKLEVLNLTQYKKVVFLDG